MAQDHTKSIIYMYYVSYLQDITSHCLGFTIDEHKWPNIISLQLNYLQKFNMPIAQPDYFSPVIGSWCT